MEDGVGAIKKGYKEKGAGETRLVSLQIDSRDLVFGKRWSEFKKETSEIELEIETCVVDLRVETEEAESQPNFSSLNSHGKNAILPFEF